MNVQRYHPALVALHWLVAVLVLAMLAAGLFGLSSPGSSPGKILLLRAHMIGGVVILALMVIRVAVRALTRRPGGRPPFAAWAVHLGAYGLIFAMVATGFATGILSGANLVAFGPAGGVLPARLDGLPMRSIHVWLALGLALLVAGHVGAALHHHLRRRDDVFRRITFGRRAA